MNIMDKGYIYVTSWLRQAKEEFMSDERGVSGIVAAVILVLIAVVLAAVFWTNINEMVTGWWSTITEKGSTIGN